MGRALYASRISDLSVLRVGGRLFWTISAILRLGILREGFCVQTRSGEKKYIHVGQPDGSDLSLLGSKRILGQKAAPEVVVSSYCFILLQ